MVIFGDWNDWSSMQRWTYLTGPSLWNIVSGNPGSASRFSFRIHWSSVRAKTSLKRVCTKYLLQLLRVNSQDLQCLEQVLIGTLLVLCTMIPLSLLALAPLLHRRHRCQCWLFTAPFQGLSAALLTADSDLLRSTFFATKQEANWSQHRQRYANHGLPKPCKR